MAGYLKKYVGTYRVLAEYDLSTNDFPRLDTGVIDPTFDDYYIKCRNGIRIIHHEGSTLLCYIPSLKRGKSVIRDIMYNQGRDFEMDNFDEVVGKLHNSDIIFNAELFDSEVTFMFKDKNIEIIAEVVKPTTNGAGISPLSPKNLPKAPYVIPEGDLSKYKNIIGEKPQEVMGFINACNREFRQNIKKLKGKKYDIKGEQRKAMLKTKEFIHSIGMWEEYILFLDKKFKESIW